MIAWLLVSLALGGSPGAAAQGCDEAPLDRLEEGLALLALDADDSGVLAGMAVCLEALELPHLAQRHWLEIVRRGRGQPGYPVALSRAFELGEGLGDIWTVGWALSGGEEALWMGSPSLDAMLLVHGTALLGREQVGMAVSVLGDVEPGSPWYAEAQLTLGRARARVGRMEGALMAWHQALLAGEGETAAEAALRSARLYAARNQVGQAMRVLEAEAIGDGAAAAARARIWLDRWEPAEAAPHVRKAVRGARRELVPEAGLLRARLQWARCRPRRAERTLQRWRGEVSEARLVLQGVMPGTSQDGHHAFLTHLGPGRVAVGLTEVQRAWLEADRRVLAVRTHLERVEAERERLQGMGGEASPVMGYLQDLLEEGQRVLRSQLGTRFLGAVRQLDRDLERLEREASELERMTREGLLVDCG